MANVSKEAVEKSIKRYMDESRCANKLTASNGNRSEQLKSGAERKRERAFVNGMCEGAFRFTGDPTPAALWLRLDQEITAEAAKSRDPGNPTTWGAGA